jgi:hypothetical protein
MIIESTSEPKLDAALGRHAGVALGHVLLDLNRTTYGVDHAAELDENAVPGASCVTQITDKNENFMAYAALGGPQLHATETGENE